MLKSYLLTALRYLSRHKLFSIIHIIGLALGIACFLLSMYHIRYEYSYDQHYSKAPSIFRLVTGDVASGEGWVKVSAPLPEKLKTDIPEIQEFARLVRLDRSSKTTVYYDHKTFYESDFFLADAAVAHFFDLNFVAGHADALKDLTTIIISRSKAQQLFGYRDPIGEVLRINDQFEFAVGGVFEDLAANSHLNMDFIVSFLNLETLLPGTSLGGNWGQYNYFAYVQLHPYAKETEVEQKIQGVKVKLNEENIFSTEAINLQALTDIHFQYNRGNLKPTYDDQNAYIYGIAAFAILIISIINYINLSTAGSTRRLKEVGLRKTMGASKSLLIFQFIGESFLITLTATLLGLLTVRYLLIDMVNALFDTQLIMDLSNPWQWLLLLGLILLISGVAGSYIAYFIIRVQPVKALKGQVSTTAGRYPIRNMLVAVQFVIAITLLSSVLFIQSQMKLFQDQDIGLQKEGVINIPLYEPQWKKDVELIKSELQQLTAVASVSATGFQPGTANWHQSVWWEGQQEDISMNIISGDVDLFQTLGLELQAGDLAHITTDLRQELTFVINESAADIIGKENVLGKSFSPFGKNNRKPIAGVVKDFNYKSLHHAIEPCVLVLGSRFEPDNLLVKIQSSNIGKALTDLKDRLAQISPNVSFEYSFIDEDFRALYSQEQRSQKIVTFYTTIAIVLSILGLFGMVSFELRGRHKELAVRKVLGISDLGLGTLISQKFLKILFFSALIAVPMTWYILNQWLQNFTYRIHLRVELFLLAIICIFLLIVATMVLKWLQFRRMNLAEVLKNE